MTGGTGINYQPSFRGALHDIDTQTQATLAAVDPSPLIITNDNGEMEAGQDTFIETMLLLNMLLQMILMTYRRHRHQRRRKNKLGDCIL